jgi:hypothetical protein
MQAADVTAAANSRLAFHPSICGYIIVLTLKTIKKRTIDLKVMPGRPALTVSAGADRSAISFVYLMFFLLP